MERSFHILLYRAFHAQRNYLRPSMLELGLGAGQPKLLGYLAARGPCYQKQLAGYFDVDPANISRMVRSLEKGGFIFTDRETVDKVEKMKVCTCLNPLHTALAVFGCLLGYDLISKEMGDPALKKLVETIGYKEGLPVVTDPGILDPKEFIDTVLNVRIPNPFMPDTPQRIATDTSQKLSIRFGETVKAYMRSDKLDVSELKCIPLVFAGWIRYLMAVDDSGAPFELSPDPLLETVRPYVASVRLGDGTDAAKAEEVLKPLLTDKEIFGVDLFEAGLAGLVCRYFEEMVKGPGAVRSALESCICLQAAPDRQI